MLYKLLHSRFLKIVLVGAAGLMAQTVVFELLAIIFQIMSASTATVIGGEFGLLTNFFLNERFSFRDRVNTADSTLYRLSKFHLVVAGSIFIQWLVVFTTEQFTSDLLYIHSAYAGGIILGFISNYTWYHLFVWKKHKEKLPA